MRTSPKLVLTALTAALVLASAISTASARNLSTTSQTFRATWSSLEFAASASTIRCRLTLEGTFHTRTIAKVRGSLIGLINRAIFVRPCTGGEAWIDNGTEVEPLGTAPNKLPFHLTYEGFRGTLPNIDQIRLLLRNPSLVFQTSFIGITCRGRYGRPEDNIIYNVSRNAPTGELGTLAAEPSANRFSLAEGLVNGGICPTSLSFLGTGNVDNGAGSRVTITLI
jgi:hypothetical protein